MTSRLSTFQIEKNSASPTTLKLPPLFSLTPNSGKGGNMQKRDIITHANQSEFVSEKISVEKPHSNNPMDSSPQGLYVYFNLHKFFQGLHLIVCYHFGT